MKNLEEEEFGQNGYYGFCINRNIGFGFLY